VTFLIHFLHYRSISNAYILIYPYLIYCNAISCKIEHLLLDTITVLFTIQNFRSAFVYTLLLDRYKSFFLSFQSYNSRTEIFNNILMLHIVIQCCRNIAKISFCNITSMLQYFKNIFSKRHKLIQGSSCPCSKINKKQRQEWENVPMFDLCLC